MIFHSRFIIYDFYFGTWSNECSTNQHSCDKNARCLNTESAYGCSCNSSFWIGDGFNCYYHDPCWSNPCPKDSVCNKENDSLLIKMNHKLFGKPFFVWMFPGMFNVIPYLYLCNPPLDDNHVFAEWGFLFDVDCESSQIQTMARDFLSHEETCLETFIEIITWQYTITK